MTVGTSLLAGILAFFTGGISLAIGAAGIAAGIASCPATGSGTAGGAAIGVLPLIPIGGGSGGKPGSNPNNPTTGKPANAAKVYGQWGTNATYGKGDTDCAVTYTCNYGLGWDEVSVQSRIFKCSWQLTSW